MLASIEHFNEQKLHSSILGNNVLVKAKNMLLKKKIKTEIGYLLKEQNQRDHETDPLEAECENIFLFY